MYWVAEPDTGVFDELVKLGLSKPVKAGKKGEIITGKPHPLPSITPVRPSFDKKQEKSKSPSSGKVEKHWRNS
jgi:hypothetical protein